MKSSLLFALAGATGAAIAIAPSGPQTVAPSPRTTSQVRAAEYLATIQRAANIVNDPQAQKLAAKLGLNVLNLTWEDTGRFKNSAVGPNISDMTIQVAVKNLKTGQHEVTLMPVIRYPNFSDLTCDLDPREFTLLVGNERGKPLRRVSLYEFLETPTRFMTDPERWASKRKTLLAPRDDKVLVSAQACFLPVPKQGLATFNPVVFNYQSVKGDPAVLTILATREGTSMTVIDNARDGFNTGWNWGQRLFFNKDGFRASLTGQRLSDFVAQGRPGQGGPGAKVADSALNMVLLIQVPLKQKYPARFGGFGGGGDVALGAPPVAEMASRSRSDVEAAVIGHGDLEGPFTEIDNLDIERDYRFPVRVTVQFYKATSNGVVSEADLAQIKREIDWVYKDADAVGSLVTGGETGRVTEYDGTKVQPADWWEWFWARYELSTGVTRWEAVARLRKLLGKDYATRPVCELYVRDLLRSR